MWILQGAPASSPPAVSIPVFRSHALPAGYGALSPGKPPNTRHFPYSEVVCLPFRIYTSGQQPFEIKWHIISIIIQCIEADTLVSHNFKMPDRSQLRNSCHIIRLLFFACVSLWRICVFRVLLLLLLFFCI